jgi:hypothetical protein
MKFSQVIGLVAVAAIASGAAIDLEKRQSLACITAAHGEGFYQGSFHADCAGLVRALTAAVRNSDVLTPYQPHISIQINDCLNKVKDTTFIWSKTSCVAAATCDGVYIVFLTLTPPT